MLLIPLCNPFPSFNSLPFPSLPFPGHRQGPRALELARAAGLEARLERDLAGVDRVLVAERSG